MDHIPKVIDLYKTLNVPYEPLSLIEPHFNCPHPPMQNEEGDKDVLQ